MLYVYGIARAGTRPPRRAGLGDPPGTPFLVERGPVAGVVSELSADHVVGEDDARTHLAVLVAALSDGPVLPLRLGTIATDDQELQREVLEPNEAWFADRLEALDGLVEVHVDADDDEAEVLASVVAEAPAPRPGADLAERLDIGRQVADLVVEHRRRVADEIVAQLRPLARADVPRARLTGAEDPVLRWAFLVERDELELFDEAVVAVRSQYPRITFRYVGPLPAAHFWTFEDAPSRSPGATSGAPSDPAADTFRGTGTWGW